MAGYLRPDDRWWIDWNNSGLYDHPYSDVTPYYHSYIVRYGADTESNPAEVQLTKAQGILRLEDSVNRFDPGSVNTDIAERNLRQPHRCKLESQYERTLFDMTISPPTRRSGGYNYQTNVDPHIGSADQPESTFPFEQIDWELVSIRYGGDSGPDAYKLFLEFSPEQSTAGEDILSRLNRNDPDWYLTISYPSLTPTPPPRRYPGTGFSLVAGNASQDLIVTSVHLDPFRGRAGVNFDFTITGKLKHILWEGTAVPTTGRRLVAEDFADFDLESRYNNLYREPITVPLRTNETLNDFLTAAMPTQWRDTTLDSKMNVMRIGRAEYEGTNQGLVNTAARYAGGWAIETRHGKIGIISWEVADDQVEVDDLIDRRWRPRRDGHLFEHRPKYVKNYAEPKALGLVTSNVTRLSTRQFTNTEFRRVSPPFPPAARRISYANTDPEVVSIKWPAINPGPPATDTSATFDKLPPVGPDRGPWSFHLQRTTGGPLEGLIDDLKIGSWILTVRATQVETVHTQRDYSFEVHLWGSPQYINVVRGVGEQRSPASGDESPKVSTPSRTDYGDLVLDLPTWYPDNAREFQICAAWIRRLGSPLRYVRLVLGRYHKNLDYLARISDLETGQIIQLTLRDVDKVDLLVKMVILGIQYEKGLDQSPTKTIYGFTVEQGDVQTYAWTTQPTDRGRFNWRDDPDTTDTKVGFWRD